MVGPTKVKPRSRSAFDIAWLSGVSAGTCRRERHELRRVLLPTNRQRKGENPPSSSSMRKKPRALAPFLVVVANVQGVARRPGAARHARMVAHREAC